MVRAGGGGVRPGASGASAALAFVVSSFGAWSTAPAAPDALASPLAGIWSGAVEHAGQSSRFVLRLEPDGEGRMVARISMPAIDVWDLPLGVAAVEDDTVTVGRWSLGHDPVAGTLVGELPQALVPVYRIPVTLRRVDSLGRSAPVSPERPVARPLWTRRTGGPIWAGAAYERGTVWVGGDDGVLRALRAADGEEIWRFATGGAIRATPTVAGRHVYVHSDDGRVYKVGRADGVEVWRATLLDAPRRRVRPGDAGSRYEHWASSPIPYKGAAWVGDAAGRLHALDERTGAGRVVIETGDSVDATVTVGQGRVYLAGFDGRVRALDARTGGEIWSYETGAPIVSSPALAGGRVVVGSRSYDLLALDAGDGALAWSRYFWFSWIESSANVRDGIVYVGSSDAQALTALDLRDGKVVWSADTGGSAWARPAVGDDAVYQGTVGVAGYIVDHRGGFVAVDRASGDVRWRYPVERPGEASLWGFGAAAAVGEGKVFVGGLDGTVYAFPQRPSRR